MPTTNRLQFTDYYLSTMLPALEHMFMEELAARPDQYVKFFNVESTTNSIVQAGEIAGLGLFRQVTEGGRVTYDAPIQGPNKTYTPVDWGSGFRITHRMAADDKYSIIKRLAKALPRAAKETVEVEAALTYNRAFSGSFLGPDGKSLCATDHPLWGGGTQANRPAVDADLDIPTLEAALTAFRKFVDHRGKKVRLRPKYLVGPPDLEFVMSEILRSPLKSGTANNNINAFSHRVGENGIEPMVYEYLTDPDAWFVLAEPSDLRVRFIWRERFATMHEVDFDSRSLKTAGWMTFTSGWDSYEGVYGSSGG